MPMTKAKPKVKAKFYAIDLEGAFEMPARRFVSLTYVPKALLPNTYKRVTLRQLSRIVGVPLDCFVDLAGFVEWAGLRWASDNSYNWGWWGPTVSFKKAELGENLTLAVVGMHCGGDVRGNYRWHYYLVDLPYDEVHPWDDIFGSIALTATVKYNGNEFVATATDIEACDWDIYPDTPENRQIWEQVLQSW
jgi:hypothetical protein